jgi:CRISPR-associated protein Cst2
VIKGIEVVTLSYVEGANLNSNGTEGVISILKKVKNPLDMKEYVRVSGQSVKYSLKQTLRELFNEELSPISSSGEGNQRGVLVSEGNPEKYIDDDLFGYMIAKKGKTLKRTAPVRTNGLISLFPYQEDRDFGVRYDPSGQEQHDIHETEITTNVMRGNFFIEADRVGKFGKGEVEKESEIDTKKREQRVQRLLKAILLYNGGSHMSRFFTKVSPEAAILVLLNKKIPVVGENFRVLQNYTNQKFTLDVSLLKGVIRTFDELIEKVYVGILNEKFSNNDEVQSLKSSKVDVVSLQELISGVEKLKIFSQ